jgi:SAM-dependent methyltransferase
MADPRKQTVRDGYDRMGERFGAWAARVEDDPRERLLDEFIALLPTSGAVLDLGCGSGLPSTRQLAGRFRVVGVDISGAQIALARRNVPEATFIQADLTEVDLPGESFDGVAALYSISHVPREQHAQLFSLVRGWLRPGGLFVAALGAGDMPDWTGEWLGVPMFFSSHDAVENVRLLEAAGLDVLRAEQVPIREPEATVTFLWALARRPSDPF